MHEDDLKPDVDDDSELELAAARQKLRTFLTIAGFDHRAGPGRRDITVYGRSAKRLLHARLNADWFHVYTKLCALPAEAGVRAELLLWTARANARIALLKYSVNGRDILVLESYLSAELVTADHVHRSILRVNEIAERDARALGQILSRATLPDARVAPDVTDRAKVP